MDVNGVKTIVTYHTNDLDQKVKTTRTVKVNKKTVLAKTLRSEAKLVQHLTTNYKDAEVQKRDIRTEIGVINAEGVVGVNKPLMQLAEAALQPKQTQPKS